MATTRNRQEQVTTTSYCKRAGGRQALIQDGDVPPDFYPFRSKSHHVPEKVTTAAMFKALNDMEWSHCYSRDKARLPSLLLDQYSPGTISDKVYQINEALYCKY